LSNIVSITGAPLAHDPTRRGYHATYRRDTVNHCPGCGRTHWLIGRLLAECAFCETALPIETSQSAPGLFWQRGKAA
jgi:hypothetical protein